VALLTIGTIYADSLLIGRNESGDSRDKGIFMIRFETIELFYKPIRRYPDGLFYRHRPHNIRYQSDLSGIGSDLLSLRPSFSG
jgi:hypothetical protein